MQKKLFSTAVKNATAILKKKKPNDIGSAIKIAQNALGQSFKGKKPMWLFPGLCEYQKLVNS